MSEVSQDVINQMHEKYQQDPNSVPEDWQAYFKALEPQATQPAAAAQPAQTAQPVATVTAASPVNGTPRSDLPPLPRSIMAQPTSPYAALAGWSADTPNEEAAHEAVEDSIQKMGGVGKAVVRNMKASLEVPTATTIRELPAKVLIENRTVINQTLAATRGGKVSFTHLIGYALVEALAEMPSMNVRYEDADGKPAVRSFAHVGFGLAIDLPKPDGTRNLMVPVVHDADTMTFEQFVAAYEDVVKRARNGELKAEDFAGATITLTNPGTIGTSHSVARLMSGQGAIIGVGATTYPAAWAGASDEMLARNGIGKVMHLSSTYDHRVIQGAGSGELLKIMEEKLTGRDGFFTRVFQSLRIPAAPYRWQRDYTYDSETEQGKPVRIAELIHAFRSRGHLAANIDPLSYRQLRHPDLDITAYGLSIWDLDRVYPTGGFAGNTKMPLRQLVSVLHSTYSHTMGVEYMHIQDPVQRRWMQERIEKPFEIPPVEVQREILSTLNRAEAFESFLQTKYVGQKRFSLEGGESLIPLLDGILREGSADGVKEVTIGMAHRGRLNVLANIGGKSYGAIFAEFEGNKDPGEHQGSGDVKYHLGTDGVFTPKDGAPVKVSLTANPSHLEASDPVTEGVVRAKQDELRLAGDENPENEVIPILVHGDAAFIGQGVVYETLNMSQLSAYRTGGTIHIIVNNQIGFTTGPTSGRSTHYCTDLAKGLQVPIFHVNGDDPEMVVRAGILAFKFRQEFNKDVIIDINCYRRRGHNESDDPSMTQPVMYSQIDKLPSTRTVYVKNLVGRGDISEDEARQAIQEYHNELDKIFNETKEHGWSADRHIAGMAEITDKAWVHPSAQAADTDPIVGWKSSVSNEVLERIGDAHLAVPEGFTPHPKMKQLLERRAQMTREGKIDWGFAELLAFGSLLMEGTPVRMSGQDARRATFVQRHAVLHDYHNGNEWTPLNFLTEGQADFQIYDSSLSEYAPLGFEYGYSIENPQALTLWEAQFGDFANTAQCIIDEFVSSAEQKWNQRSGLVMLLPHGYEGMGPDHSSARIERYLSLAAQDNMHICQPSTPANYFHLLREHAYQRPRKPLIVFTPKQLLRLSSATSPVADFTSGEFQHVLGDAQVPGNVQKVIMCSGRVYYDLVKQRKAAGMDDQVAILRIEQYYPLPTEALQAELAKHPGAELRWVQDEPANQGPWTFLQMNVFLPSQLQVSLVSRPAYAAPSAGNAKLHKTQAEQLMKEAFSF
ncbi:MAG: multifunctional oxoglutarate decarboxylase/oxoglutarate dehydrogenase thiamine pyrophosphate-binding subunit/dihydrolipoyllysine-residue succinyltransferase subunit [Varibaculum sp.]|nr:multifunctional oxoglutarate decarboxylase/oxoglutarate dehydrogenase thiamine pyrophosphate-binding subunit/dihydrolipoyllysine-residue succinyltransferase subunit [Varibaculum sp.]